MRIETYICFRHVRVAAKIAVLVCAATAVDRSISVGSQAAISTAIQEEQPVQRHAATEGKARQIFAAAERLRPGW